MIKLRENEEAVSPVIGVILMVAITVILAAVIAAFVFGMGSGVQTTKVVAATATQQGDSIVVTYQGGTDAGDVVYLRVEVDPSSGGKTTNYYFATDASVVQSKSTIPDTGDSASPGKIPVGTNWKYSVGTPEKDHVVVAAHFSDGSDQVILDTFV